ncbi:aspartokinase [Algimonas arctica]|uniref:Aspartokinase n=1 Tax=Algimonas arctica TaxID=1479486 RepID=A0A8J3CR67_9PROT|nr:aspartate kinase [Algimonas arctica]GHA99936.1 aspartokinase [Algimonas arctica]
MGRIVMKFGGTSVADLDRIRAVSKLVAAEVAAGHEVAVVVSAMSGETNRLVSLVDALDKDMDPTGEKSGGAIADEYDSIVSSGEQVTSGLLAIALRRRGIPARSWLGWQIPLKTDMAHSKARIGEIESSAIGPSMAQGTVAVVAGFQGINKDDRISTLGRGGSDTSAVAIAVALKADRCDIYTDVDGIYTTDPRIVPDARRLNRIAFEEMLELASLGAKVLQVRSVELAMNYNLPIRVLTSMADEGQRNPGTLVCHEDLTMEERVVSGVAYSRDEAQITLLKLSDKPGMVAKVCKAMSDAGIIVDMIVQGISRSDNSANLTFTVGERDLEMALAALDAAKQDIGFAGVKFDRDVTKVSVVGIGMRSHTGVAQTMFEALAAKGINISVIATSEIKISVLIDSEYTELAVRALHSAFDLHTTPAPRVSAP